MQNTEMDQKEISGKFHGSIKWRTFLAIMVLAGFISVAAVWIGFFLYSDEAIRESRVSTWLMTKTISSLLIFDDMSDETHEVLDTYENTSNEVVDDTSNAYLDLFKWIQDEDYLLLVYSFSEMVVDNNAKAVYLAALSPKGNRLIYILDAHMEESDGKPGFYPPGHWEFCSPKTREAFLNGTQYSALDDLYAQEPIPSVLMRKDGDYRCVAAKPITVINGYQVMLFVEKDMNQMVHIGRVFLIIYILLMLTLTAIAAFLMTRWARIKVVQPINKLARAANAYAVSKKSGNSAGHIFENLDIHTGDEIENLSNTMDAMAKDLTEYEVNLANAAAEKERINTELDVATHIQVGMLPHDFEQINANPAFDLYASMVPAREVGGDFYDYFYVDDTHIALVMADVSGKGIPAALFMMHSMTLIRNRVMADDTPGEALTIVNHQLIEGNEADMFVTVWLAVIDLTTGKGIAANAGHEHPALKRAGGQYELIRYRHSLVVGMMDGIKITEHEFELHPGDSIFVYTDGVTEATSHEKELFGDARLLEALNLEPEASPRKTLENVSESIRRFVGDEEQFDDITMLCFHYISDSSPKDGINDIPLSS